VRCQGAHHLVRGESEQPFGRRIPAGDTAIRRVADDGVSGALDQRGKESVVRSLMSRVVHPAIVGALTAWGKAWAAVPA